MWCSKLSVRRYVLFVWVLNGKVADPGEVGRQLASEFTESGDVTTHLAGGSDAAGFVQAMKVSGADRQRVEAD